MRRRAFLTISATSLAGLAFGNRLSSLSESNLEKKYSIVLLGDTHFDTEPASVYHADYNGYSVLNLPVMGKCGESVVLCYLNGLPN